MLHQIHFAFGTPASFCSHHPKRGPRTLCAFEAGSDLHFAILKRKLVLAGDACSKKRSWITFRFVVFDSAKMQNAIGDLEQTWIVRHRVSPRWSASPALCPLARVQNVRVEFVLPQELPFRCFRGGFCDRFRYVVRLGVILAFINRLALA